MNRRIWREVYRNRQGNALSNASRFYYLYTDEGLIAEATQAITINADGTTSAIADDPVTPDNESAAHITAQYGLMPDAAL